MTHTEAQKVFEVMEVDQEDDSTWIIYGLTYANIAVGDTLHIHSTTETSEMTYLPIEVVRILVFENREVSEVDVGYYSKLFVVGDGREMVKKNDHFYST